MPPPLENKLRDKKKKYTYNWRGVREHNPPPLPGPLLLFLKNPIMLSLHYLLMSGHRNLGRGGVEVIRLC